MTKEDAYKYSSVNKVITNCALVVVYLVLSTRVNTKKTTTTLESETCAREQQQHRPRRRKLAVMSVWCL
jgi:hypothetical protein